MLVVEKSKDIGMGVRKDTVVSFVPTLFGCFLGIPSLYVFLCIFVTCFSSFLGGGGGGGGREGGGGGGISKLLTPDTHVCYSGDNNSSSGTAMVQGPPQPTVR